MLGLVSAVLSCTILNPSLAQSRNKRITLSDRVNPDPLIVRGISGGKVEATNVVETEGTTTGFCNGFVENRPNHILVLKNFFEFLKIEVDSSTDTTIIIEGPGGVWCNDDYIDANPAIEGQWKPGRYRIWIGSYQEDINYDYQIKITGND
jgi:hypothetical protein